MNIKIFKTCRPCKCSGEKKYFSLFLFVFSALLVSFAFLSCDGLAQKIDGCGYSFLDNEKEFIITGTLSVNGAVPSEVASVFRNGAENENANAKTAVNENSRSVFGDFESDAGSSGSELSARTAIPSIQTPSSYTVSATSTSGGKTVQGEVEPSGTFTIKLSSAANETWTVKVEGFSDSARSTKILEGSTTVMLSANSVDNNISITLSPVSSGSGRVNLTVGWENNTGIKLAKMTFEDLPDITPDTSPSMSYTTNLFFSSIPFGSYTVRIDFYDSNVVYPGKDVQRTLLYSTHEVINVFSNLTTDTWQGSASYLTGTDTNKTFSVTKALVDDFTNRKTFYVQGTSGTYKPPTNASDTNSGTYFDPFATIQKAVNTINAINDGTSAYTIKVDGTLTITTPASESNDSAVSIQPNKNLNLTIESLSTAKATIKANSNGMRVFIVGNGANTAITPNVTMKNLIITGGKAESGGGGGIKLEAGNLTLSNVEVKNNTTTDVGGGIYVRVGNCNITNGTISSNTAQTSGGGIYVADSGSCTITGGVISNNSAAYQGGGVFLANLGSMIKIRGGVSMSGNQLTNIAQQGTGTAIYANAGATAELDGSSGTISITTGRAQGGALPSIYLAQGVPGSTTTGGSGGGSDPIPDAVLKLGGNIQIGNGNGTGIKLKGKMKTDEANIKITYELTSEQTINISYDDAQINNPIIESENSRQLKQEDCDKFIVNTSNKNYKLKLDGSKNKGICANAF